MSTYRNNWMKKSIFLCQNPKYLKFNQFNL